MVTAAGGGDLRALAAAAPGAAGLTSDAAELELVDFVGDTKYDRSFMAKNNLSTNGFVSKKAKTFSDCLLRVKKFPLTFLQKYVQLIDAKIFQILLRFIFLQKRHHVLGQSRRIRIAAKKIKLFIRNRFLEKICKNHLHRCQRDR